MAPATKEDVGADASKSQTHVKLNSGYQMPLFGWGSAMVPDEAVAQLTKSAIDLKYTVASQQPRGCHVTFSTVLVLCTGTTIPAQPLACAQKVDTTSTTLYAHLAALHGYTHHA